MLGLLVAAGCESAPRTQVMVFVRAEPSVMARAERLEVEILGGASSEVRTPTQTLVYTSASISEGNPLSWPVRIALIPADGDASRTYEVVATAFDVDGAFARTRVVSGYLARETLTLDVWLRDDCVGQLCEAGQTCVAGGCAAVPSTDPCALDRLDGGTPQGCVVQPDAGSGDAGSSDAGPNDAGPSDGGPGDAGSLDAGPPDPLDLYNAVFVTSTTHRGSALGGIDGAHAICQARAMTAGLADPESYRALLPTTSTTAVSVLGGARGWVRMDGLPFADRVQDLMAGRILYPVALTELRGPPGDPRVATAMNYDMSRRGGTCSDWSAGGFLDSAGDARTGPGLWVYERGAVSCDDPVSLYCFGTSRSVALPARSHPAGAGLAFVSQATIAPSASGLAAMDAVCAAEGSDASFLALVSPDDTTSAVSRFTFAGPWYRPDGVQVAESLADVSSEQLLAPIATTNSVAPEYGNFGIWTGSASPAETSNTTCAGWTNSSTGTGFGGSAASTVNFFTGSSVGCGAALRVLCLSNGPI